MSTSGDSSGAEESSQEFMVEKILATRRRNGKREFRIRWKGYGPEEDTWEPEDNCDCTELIEEFLREAAAAKTAASGKRGGVGGSGSSAKSKQPQKPPGVAATAAMVETPQPQQPQQQPQPASTTAPTTPERSSEAAAETDADAAAAAAVGVGGFDRGLEPEKIVGAAKLDGKLHLLVSWRNSEHVDLVPAPVVNQRCPSLVIAFYESSVSWYHDEDEDAPI